MLESQVHSEVLESHQVNRGRNLFSILENKQARSQNNNLKGDLASDKEVILIGGGIDKLVISQLQYLLSEQSRIFQKYFIIIIIIIIIILVINIVNKNKNKYIYSSNNFNV